MTDETSTIYIAHRRESDGTTQTVTDHLFEVGSLTSIFAGKLGLGNHGELIGLLHDLGKYSSAFLSYINEGKLPDGKTKIDHSSAGAQFIWKQLSEIDTMSSVVGQFLSLCIASHHSGLIDCLMPDGADRFSKRMQKAEAEVHLNEALQNADPNLMRRVQQIASKPLLVSELRSVLQSVANRQRLLEVSYCNQRTCFMAGTLLRLLFSCLIDADRTNTADFDSPEYAKLRPHGAYVDWGVLIERLEMHLQALKERNPIDRLRRTISDQCLLSAERIKGIYTLTVPTGGGKTLSSLRFALNHARKWKLERIIYVLPFTTIIDQNAGETRKVLETNGFSSVILEHHSNLVPEKETKKSKVLSENWDASVIYTTMAHVLEAMFGSGTREVRRMHRLANAILVFDEVQALPIRTVHLFCNAVNFLVDHCGSSVVLCTATQPLLHQVDKSKGAIALGENSEIVEDVGDLFQQLKRVDVIDGRKIGGWTDREVVDLARNKLEKFGSCLVVVNTKKAALSLYQECKKDPCGASIYHLSTNMCPAHRVEILEQIWKRLGKNGNPPERKEPLICFSTQLIEAGVDVDFGAAIRFAAGLDSIAQVAGRCNRNGKREKGILTIVNPVDENLGALDDIRAGREAAIRILGEWHDGTETIGEDLLSPNAMERYFRYYFFDRKHLMDYPISVERDDTLLNMLGENSNAVSEFRRVDNQTPKMYLRQSFMSAAKYFRAIDSPTQGIIVPYGDGSQLITKLSSTTNPKRFHSLLREAQRYSVNVYPWMLERLRERRLVHEVQRETGIHYLEDGHYCYETGLTIDAITGLQFLDA